MVSLPLSDVPFPFGELRFDDCDLYRCRLYSVGWASLTNYVVGSRRDWVSFNLGVEIACLQPSEVG